MGLVTGYHLQLAGAQVTFLVRPGRVAAFAAPCQLYSYDDQQLKRFDGYRVVDDLAPLLHEAFGHILITLDSHALRQPDGLAMLNAVTRYLHAHPDSVLIVGSVGLGVREHVLQHTGLPPERVLRGALALLAHQVHANLPVLAPTDPAQRAQAAQAYRHVSGQSGFVIDSQYKAQAQRFAALYNRCGVSQCTVAHPRLLDLMATAFFPMLAASHIAGWPEMADLVAQRELWLLSCQAQKEICQLPQHGWVGKLAGWLMTPGITARMHLRLERTALPLHYQAFNRFHHGGKVHVQDVQVQQACLASGTAQGHAMPGLQELLRRLEAFDRAANAAQ